MGWEAWFTLSVVGLVLFALIRHLAPPDMLLWGGTVVIGLTGLISREHAIITPQEMFAGMTNQGMLTVAALFVVAAALRETGVLDLIGQRLLGLARSEKGAIMRLAAPVVGTSAFLNNTPVVAMLMPIVADWCRKHRISPSRLLIPLSFLAILGGTCTLIGTSTNLVVNGLMIDESAALSEQARAETDPSLQQDLEREAHSLRAMSLFEIGKMGLPYTVLGVLYLLTVGRRLLPDRKDLLEQFGESPREFTVDMQIEPGCRLINKTIAEAGLRRLPGLFLIGVTRNEQVISPVGPDLVLLEGDRLTFTGVVSTIVDLERIAGLVPVADDSYSRDAAERRSAEYCEAVISGTSPLIHKNIRDANFRALYNAAVIAVHRGGMRLRGRIGDMVLQPGDTLLLQTGPHFARAHQNNPDFYLVSSLEGARPVRHERAFISVSLLLLLVVLMALAPVLDIPIVLTAFAVAGLMIATRCISAGVARQSVDWQTLLTIIGAFGLAKGLQNSGAAKGIADALFSMIGTLSPRAMLAAVYLIALVFTELITNNAAAVLVFPLALAVANEQGWDARPFAMAVAFAASASFITPIGYQTNMMVYGPGGYRFTDFTRVGTPLTVLSFVMAVFLIPIIWPF